MSYSATVRTISSHLIVADKDTKTFLLWPFLPSVIPCQLPFYFCIFRVDHVSILAYNREYFSTRCLLRLQARIMAFLLGQLPSAS